MSDRRSSHRQKTREDRKEYWATTVRGIEPTAPSMEIPRDITQSTDYSLASDEEEIRPLSRIPRKESLY